MDIPRLFQFQIKDAIKAARTEATEAYNQYVEEPKTRQRRGRFDMEMELLDNYKNLVARIDALCQAINTSLGERITCSEGCSSCCTAITLFPVEAAALQAALDELPEQESEAIRLHVIQHGDSERCPLLSNHRCLLYKARPIICRTHGLPIIYTEDNLRKSDCCPLNLSDAESISGSSVIDLDKLNPLLVAVNSLYLSQSETGETAERLTIVEAIFKRK